MGVFYKRTNPNLGSVGTTKYLTIPTSPATLLTLDSGYMGLTVFNNGSGNLIWGDSNIAVNSGNYQFVNVRTEWYPLTFGWSQYLRAESVATLISVTEYNV